MGVKISDVIDYRVNQHYWIVPN